MTVQASPYKQSYTFLGFGSATQFPFQFLIFQASDLVVQKFDAAGNGSTLVQGPDYSLTGVLYPGGGVVTLTVALTVGQGVTLFRDPAVAQRLALQQGGAYDPMAVMTALDYLAMELQAVKDRAMRSPRAPVSEAPTEAGMTMPPASRRALQLLGFDAGGNPAVVQPSAASMAAVGLPLNVLDFGADPTGATSSQLAFSKAIATIKALSVQSGSIGGVSGQRATITRALYVPRGIYKIDQQLLIDFAGFTMYGDGAANSVLAQSWTPATYADAVICLSPWNAAYTDPWTGVAQGYSIHDLSFVQTSGGFQESADGSRKGCAIIDAGNGTGRLVNLRFSGFGCGFLSYGADEMVADQVIAEFCDYGFVITDAGEKWDFRNCIAYVCHTGLWMQAAHTIRAFNCAFICCYDPVILDEVTIPTPFGTTPVNGPCRNIAFQSCWFESQVVSASPLRMMNQCIRVNGTSAGARVVVNVQVFDTEVSAFWDGVVAIPANASFLRINYGRNVVVRNLHVDRTGLLAYVHHTAGDDIIHLENLGPQQRWSPTTGSGWGYLPLLIAGDQPHYRFVDDQAHLDTIVLGAGSVPDNPPTRTDLPVGTILPNHLYTNGAPIAWFWNGSTWLPWTVGGAIVVGALGTFRSFGVQDTGGAIRWAWGADSGNPEPVWYLQGFDVAGVSRGYWLTCDHGGGLKNINFLTYQTSFGDPSLAQGTLFSIDAQAGQNRQLNFNNNGVRRIVVYADYQSDFWIDTYNASNAYQQSPLWIPNANNGVVQFSRPMSFLNSVAAANPAANEVTVGAGLVKAASAYWVGAVQVLAAQQTGLGASLATRTAAGTYGATEQTMLQEAHDKIRKLEVMLKAHGMVAT